MVRTRSARRRAAGARWASPAEGRALRERLDDVPLRVARATGLTEAELVALRDTLTRVTETIHRQKEQ